VRGRRPRPLDERATRGRKLTHDEARCNQVSGFVPRGKATTALQLFDEVRAMTCRLLHPKP
jgi:hypothetical protein